MELPAARLAELALATAAGRGDPDAIARLETLHGAAIGFACHRFAGPAHSADDLRQILREHLFVGAHPRIADYDGRGSLATWLRVTALRLFIDLTRRKDRAREAALDDPPDLVDPTDLNLEAIKAEYRAAVAASLVEAARQLAPGDRHLLRQHLVAGLTVEQLGAVLGVHKATAARRIARARDELASRTRALLIDRLPPDELGEVFDLVISKLDVSIRRVLATP